MQPKFDQLKSEAIAALKKVSDRDALESLRVELLGRKGKMAELM